MNPGILSAIGMLMADVIKDYSQTVMKSQFEVTSQDLSTLFLDLERKGVEDLAQEGIERKGVHLERYLDMRYEGQSYEIIVPFDDRLIENFHSLHEKKYGYRNVDKTVEIVNIRLRSRGVPEKPSFEKLESGAEQLADGASVGEKEVVFDHEPFKTEIILRDKLLAGNRLPSPCILVEYSSTIVVPPFAQGTVDPYGNIILDIKS